MQSILGIKNIVLIGTFNVNNFDKYFFIKNKIVTEEAILPGSIFDPVGGVIQLVTDKFNIVISLQQIIISATKLDDNSDGTDSIMSQILICGGITNTTALGINFHWFLSDDQISFAELSRKFFYNDKIKVFEKFFNTDDSMFGAYASTQFKDARLKLDVKPNIINNTLTKSTQNVLNFAFNFHFDSKNKSNSGDEILGYLKEYEVYRSESEKIMSIYK